MAQSTEYLRLYVLFVTYQRTGGTVVMLVEVLFHTTSLLHQCDVPFRPIVLYHFK